MQSKLASAMASNAAKSATKVASKAASKTATASKTASNKAKGILKPSKYSPKGTPVAPDADNDSDLSEPLLSDEDKERSRADVEGDDASARSGVLPDPTEMSQNDWISTLAVGALATAGLAASLAAMVAFPGGAVILMGLVCMGNAPAMGTKQLVIAKSQGVRDSVNLIREEIDFLNAEVDFVEHAVNDLQAEANVLKGVEESLQQIVEEQGTNVNTFVKLVNENQEVLDQMKSNLKQTFTSAVTAIIIRCDVDGDMKIDLKELPLLSLSLKTHLDPLGIELDTDIFEAMVKENNDISNVLKFCGEVLYADGGDDKDDDDSVDSQVTFDFESFVQTLDDESPRVSTVERLGMVHISDKYTKGSVEAARGQRSSLGRSSWKENPNGRKTTRTSMIKQVKKRQTKVATRGTLRQVRRGRETRVTMGGLVTIRGTAAEV